MNLAGIAASAAALALLSAVGATAKPVAATVETNLRKEPGTKSEVVTLIPKGTTVEVGKCSNGWCQASLNGQDGYVIARNVGMASPRRLPRGSEIVDDEAGQDGPPPADGPPVYYGYDGYGPYYGYGWGWAHYGWGRRW